MIHDFSIFMDKVVGSSSLALVSFSNVLAVLEISVLGNEGWVVLLPILRITIVPSRQYLFVLLLFWTRRIRQHQLPQLFQSARLLLLLLLRIFAPRRKNFNIAPSIFIVFAIFVPEKGTVARTPEYRLAILLGLGVPIDLAIPLRGRPRYG